MSIKKKTIRINIEQILNHISQFILHRYAGEKSVFELASLYTIWNKHTGKPFFELGEQYVLIDAKTKEMTQRVYDGASGTLSDFLISTIYKRLDDCTPVYYPGIPTAGNTVSIRYNPRAVDFYRRCLETFFRYVYTGDDSAYNVKHIIEEFMPDIYQAIKDIDNVDLSMYTDVYIDVEKIVLDIEAFLIDDLEFITYPADDYYTFNIKGNFLEIKREGKIVDLELQLIRNKLKKEHAITSNNFSVYRVLYDDDPIDSLSMGINPKDIL